MWNRILGWIFIAVGVASLFMGLIRAGFMAIAVIDGNNQDLINAARLMPVALSSGGMCIYIGVRTLRKVDRAPKGAGSSKWDDDGDELLAAARRRKMIERGESPKALDRRDESSTWTLGRAGMRFVLIGSALAVTATCFLVGTQFLAKEATPPPALVWTVVGSGLALVVGCVVHLLGQCLCCFSPPQFRGPAIGFCGTLLFSIGAIVFVGVMSMPSRIRTQDVDEALRNLRFAGVPLVIAMAFFWMTYLQRIAKSFGTNGLVWLCNTFLAAQILFIAAALLVSLDGLPPGPMPIQHKVLAGAQIALALWYLVVVESVCRVLLSKLDGENGM